MHSVYRPEFGFDATEVDEVFRTLWRLRFPLGTHSGGAPNVFGKTLEARLMRSGLRPAETLPHQKHQAASCKYGGDRARLRRHPPDPYGLGLYP
jgi:hypothetical protein